MLKKALYIHPIEKNSLLISLLSNKLVLEIQLGIRMQGKK